MIDVCRAELEAWGRVSRRDAVGLSVFVPDGGVPAKLLLLATGGRFSARRNIVPAAGPYDVSGLYVERPAGDPRRTPCSILGATVKFFLSGGRSSTKSFR